MKKVIILFPVLTLVAILLLAACNNANNTASAAETVVSADSLLKRGNYLVNSIGCDDCHSPKKMGAHGPEVDPAYRFAGHLANRPIGKIDGEAMKNGWLLFSMDLTAAVGPWGVSYAANISSDETGIGTWTEDQFIYAMREGKLKGQANGRPLLPPMPWQNFKKLSDLDLKAIFAYLKSSNPVENVVPAPQPPAGAPAQH